MRVYLDSHSTTPVDPRVLDAMLPFFREDFGNASSANHAWGWRAKEAVEAARRDVATLVGAAAKEIVFTSGATESNTMAMLGIVEHVAASKRHVVVSAIEHKSVLEASSRLARQGWMLTVAPVHADGRLDLDALRAAVTPATALVSVMAANNEIGTIQPIAEVSAVARAHGALVHVDAAQAAGKIPVDVGALGVDLMSMTAHKMYGPKGVGAIYIRKGTRLTPLITGGSHERGWRAGTLNVPGIVGFGRACDIARGEMTAEPARLTRLRDRLLEGLQAQVGGVTVNGSLTHRLPQNLHVSIAGVDGRSLLIGIGDIAISSGSACASASAEPSHVLSAILGVDVPLASIRFGLSRFTTEDEIDYTIAKFETVVRHLRSRV